MHIDRSVLSRLACSLCATAVTALGACDAAASPATANAPAATPAGCCPDQDHGPVGSAAPVLLAVRDAGHPQDARPAPATRPHPATRPSPAPATRPTPPAPTPIDQDPCPPCGRG